MGFASRCRLLAMATLGLSAVAWGQPTPHVDIRLPNTPVPIGSFVPIEVQVVPSSAIPGSDIDLVVPDGPSGGVTSLVTTQGKPARRLCAGAATGRHILQAKRRSTGEILAEAPFTITNRWTSTTVGPPLCVLQTRPPSGLQFSWGGGGSGPQNIPTTPQVGSRAIAVLFVDTATQRFPTDPVALNALKSAWNQSFGATAPDSSVIRYYDTVSYAQLKLTSQIFGPVSLDGPWSDYFAMDPSSGVWTLTGANFYSEAISKADKLINYDHFETVVFVTASVSATQFAWPETSDAYLDTDEGEHHFGLTAMPVDWHTVDAREVFETVSHELGHTLGLADQYGFDNEDPSSSARHVTGWDPMDWEGGLPQFSIGHRLMLGWLQPSWIKTYNFSGGSVPPPAGDNITLVPLESGPPGAGRFSAVEVRIADGWNYYFEYRNSQAGQAGDQNLPSNSSVVGYDVIGAGYVPPLRRRQLLLLPSGASYKDGPVLGPGKTYEERDPTFPADLDVSVIDTGADHATINVKYGANGHADPSIRPWPASDDNKWQSPDIEIRNARNGMGDPTSEWFNVPWSGHANTIIAKVRNLGDADAPKTRVRFSVFDFTLGGEPAPSVLGEDQRDIPKGGGPIEFQIPWTPSSGDHICVRAEIPLYQDPTTSIVEKTELNNVAQSNYTRFISSSASPASREGRSVVVRNPLSRPALITLIPRQTNPLYRSYLAHSWVSLGGGETRSISVESEYGGDEIERRMQETSDGVERNRLSRMLETYRSKPNTLSVEAHLRNVGKRDSSTRTLGGVQMRVDHGLATKVDLTQGTGFVTGRVTLVRGGPAPDGKVIVSVKRSGQGVGSPPTDIVGRSSSGRFRIEVPPDWASASAYFVAPRGVADSESSPVTRSR